jgi:hypothetical protein
MHAAMQKDSPVSAVGIFSHKMLQAGVFKYLQPLPISSQGVKFLFCGSLALAYSSLWQPQDNLLQSIFVE